jgi:hypothetical protein
MRERRITVPELALFGLTRAMIGFGAGLLLSPRFVRDERPKAGKVLLAIGALSTIPIAVRLLRQRRETRAAEEMEPQVAIFAVEESVPFGAAELDDIESVTMLVSE